MRNKQTIILSTYILMCLHPHFRCVCVLPCADVVSTLAGGDCSLPADGLGTSALFGYPWGVALDGSGLAYVTDNGNAVRVVTAAGVCMRYIVY